MKRIFIISLLVFAASLRTVAADYHFRHFTKENGSLPYDAVRVLYEDSRGHIWIGTQNGLSVFDGKRFKIFDRSQFGVESDYVSSIAEAAGGDIWVGTDKGIVVYDIESGGFRTLPSSLVQSRVYAMQRDTSGIIWIGVNGRGLFKAKEDEVTRIPNLDISDVYRIAINKDGSLVLASYCNNIFTYDPSAGSESLRPVANGAFFKDDVEGIVAAGLNGMSGVELCRTIAADENLAHIPIIVISAISSVDVKIKCVESGAAAYIEKPFSLDYLFACIKGVFDKRESIKASAAPVSESAPIVLANRDADFIKALDELIAKNISNPDFSNKDMEKELLVSHSSLSRRMNALLGQTPNEYLRKKRMEEAARLLSESSSALVAELCYAVGFNSPSYFAKRFKEHFGISPLEYQKQKSG